METPVSQSHCLSSHLCFLSGLSQADCRHQDSTFSSDQPGPYQSLPKPSHLSVLRLWCFWIHQSPREVSASAWFRGHAMLSHGRKDLFIYLCWCVGLSRWIRAPTVRLNLVRGGWTSNKIIIGRAFFFSELLYDHGHQLPPFRLSCPNADLLMQANESSFWR